MGRWAVTHRICETVTMKNITVSVDEGTYRRARIRAAELDTSVSALVRNYLRSMAGDGAASLASAAPGSEAAVELRRRKLDDVLADFDARGVGLDPRDNLSREELYDRDAARAEAERELRRSRPA